MEDALGFYCAQAVAPAINTEGKKKYQKAGQGKYILHARIHVELTCDFSLIYNSEGHYDHTSKKQLNDIHTIILMCESVVPFN